MQVDVLINNAGFGEYGEFLRSRMEMQLDMVQVNCTAVVHLTRLFLPAMAARRQGAVMIVASTASYQPVPYLATYGATKAFDRMLAEALGEEMKRHGVRVSAHALVLRNRSLPRFPECPQRASHNQPYLARLGLEARPRQTLGYSIP
jgi:short-subunit dehydrogenase